MLYNPPSGTSDPNGPYLGKNVGAGQQGSRVPRLAVEAPQREIVAFINAGVGKGLPAPTNDDLTQMLKVARSGLLDYYVGTGVANATAIAPDPVYVALVEGMRVRVKWPAANTAPATTLQVNALPAKTVLRRDGSAISAGDLLAARTYTLEYDGAAFRVAGGALPSEGAASGGSGGTGGSSGVSSGVAGAFGRGQFAYVGPTQVRFAPVDGSQLYIDSAFRTIPAGGVMASNAGLAPFTLYYAYAAMVAGVMTLELSTSAYAIDAATGFRTKTGDPTRTLVGAAITGAGSPGAFVDGLTRSWFGDASPIQTTGAAGSSTYSLSAVVLSGTALSVLAWDTETIDVEYVGHGANSAQNAGYYAWMRAIIASADGSTVLAAGPQTRGGGAAFVATGLASRAVYKPGTTGAFTVRAEGYGDGSGAYASFAIAGFVRTRG